MSKKIRVAVVGGGCASMAAAFELTRPEHEGRYEVTVYQQGFRLAARALRVAEQRTASKNTGCTSGWAGTRTPSACSASVTQSSGGTRIPAASRDWTAGLPSGPASSGSADQPGERRR